MNGLYEYKGYCYRPEILEDEDTRKYVHNVYLDNYVVGVVGKSHWYMVTLDEFETYVDTVLLKV